MKIFILSSISILALSASTVYAGGGFSRLFSVEGSYPIVRNRIPAQSTWLMPHTSRKYGTLRSTFGSTPSKPMPEEPSYEEMPRKVRFLDNQHERYVLKTGSVKETSKDSLPTVEKKNSNTTIFTPQKKK